MGTTEHIENDRLEIESFFTQDVQLSFSHLNHTYCVFQVDSVDGYIPTETINISYYYDEQCLNFDYRTPNLAGKLTVGTPMTGYDASPVYPTGKGGYFSYKLRNNYDENSELNDVVEGLIVPADNSIGTAITDIAAFLAIGYTTMYKTGCTSHWREPQHDLDSALAVADIVFGFEGE